MDWRRFDGDGPPSAATLAAESTASEPTLRPPTPWDELNRARYICWVCTAEPGDELPLRFHPWDTAPAATATAEGAVTITICENPATDAQEHQQPKPVKGPDVSQPGLL
jgi:hypothetical protein